MPAQLSWQVQSDVRACLIKSGFCLSYPGDQGVRNYPSIFGESFLSLGLEAYRNAAELLPRTLPAPHTGNLALLSLRPHICPVPMRL